MLLRSYCNCCTINLHMLKMMKTKCESIMEVWGVCRATFEHLNSVKITVSSKCKEINLWWKKIEAIDITQHTHTQPFYTTVLLLFWKMSGTTRVSRYQKGKTSKVKTDLDLLEQEIVSGSGICWAICKSAPHPRQPRQHPTLSFLQAGCPSCRPTNSVKSTEGKITQIHVSLKTVDITSQQKTTNNGMHINVMVTQSLPPLYVVFCILSNFPQHIKHSMTMLNVQCFAFSALMLLVGQQEGHPAWVVGCWQDYLSEARCRFAYGPAGAIAIHYLLLRQIQIDFTFPVPAHPGSPGKTAAKWVLLLLLLLLYIDCSVRVTLVVSSWQDFMTFIFPRRKLAMVSKNKTGTIKQYQCNKHPQQFCWSPLACLGNQSYQRRNNQKTSPEDMSVQYFVEWVTK